MVLWTLRQSRLVDLVSGDVLDEDEQASNVSVKPTDSALPFDTARLFPSDRSRSGCDGKLASLSKRKEWFGPHSTALPANRRHKLLVADSDSTSSEAYQSTQPVG